MFNFRCYEDLTTCGEGGPPIPSVDEIWPEASTRSNDCQHLIIYRQADKVASIPVGEKEMTSQPIKSERITRLPLSFSV